MGARDEMRPDAAKRLRDEYRERWGREWPFDHKYLTELWTETKALFVNPRGNYRVSNEAMRQHCLTLMRECHVFEEVAP